jgi:hypothetical protein
MRPLSEWLELMLAEIAQRHEQQRAATEEAARRAAEASGSLAAASQTQLSQDATHTEHSSAPAHARAKARRASIA